MRLSFRHLTLLALFTAGCTNPLEFHSERDHSDEAAWTDATDIATPLTLGADEAVLTILGTNDIHGGFETQKRGSTLVGGADYLAGYIKALRAHLNANYAGKNELLVLDAGDAAQGTLISNHSEGLLAAQVMSEVGYTAAVLGNHAFDFGPLDWTLDQCYGASGCDGLEALQKQFLDVVKFPVLASNVTYGAGGAQPAGTPFLPPYIVVPFQGRGVAVIGLENPATPATTIKENISGLKFARQEVQALIDQLRAAKQADLFVVVMHDGGASVADLPADVSAVVAGHTHKVESSAVGDTPFVQSGGNGTQFGLIQLVVQVDPATGELSVDTTRTRLTAGVAILAKKHKWLGEQVEPVKAITDLLSAQRVVVDPLAQEFIASTTRPFLRGTARAGKLDQHRIADSEAGNLIADMMREAAGTDLAIVNSGEIRSMLPSLSRDTITFEELFLALPRNARMIQASAVPMDAIVENIEASIRSCGRRGALQVSGLTIVFRRDCAARMNDKQEDPQAELVKLVSDSGQVLWENAQANVATLKLVTTDFIFLEGGAGFPAFVGLPHDPGLDPLRDAVRSGLQAIGTLDPAGYAPSRYINCEAPNETDQPPDPAIVTQFCP